MGLKERRTGDGRLNRFRQTQPLQVPAGYRGRSDVPNEYQQARTASTDEMRPGETRREETREQGREGKRILFPRAWRGYITGDSFSSVLSFLFFPLSFSLLSSFFRLLLSSNAFYRLLCRRAALPSGVAA